MEVVGARPEVMFTTVPTARSNSALKLFVVMSTLAIDAAGGTRMM
jgi:hypothetical protein